MTKSRYRFRLILGIPVVVACFTLAAGFLPLNILDSEIGLINGGEELAPLLINLKIAMLFIALVASGIAFAISRYIIAPVEEIIGTMRELNPNPSAEDMQMANDEITSLSNLYNQTFVPLKGYLRSADLFMQMSEGIISLNKDRSVAFLNSPIEELLDIRKEDYLGKSYIELFPGSARNFQVLKIIDDALTQSSFQTRDIIISTRSGRDVYVRATASPAKSKGKEAIGVVIMIRDIEEFSRLRDQLRKIDVLAPLGSTISGMAHEVRTPLGYIRSLAELTAEDLPPDAPQQEYLKTIVASIERLNTMVEDILTYASVQVDSSKIEDPVTIVREAIAYSRNSLIEREVKLVEEYPDDRYVVRGDRSKLIEVFTGMFKNACEATPREGTITVRVRPVHFLHPSEPGQTTVMIEFHNQGSYIPAENIEKLFVPFFTTKKEGTGLGLAIAKQLIEAHEGTIHVESDPSNGTLFRVLLPSGLHSVEAVAEMDAATP